MVVVEMSVRLSGWYGSHNIGCLIIRLVIQGESQVVCESLNDKMCTKNLTVI